MLFFNKTNKYKLYAMPCACKMWKYTLPIFDQSKLSTIKYDLIKKILTTKM